MNTSVIYLFMMFIMAENIQKDVLVNTSDVKAVPFYENTKSLHIMTNQLFAALKLNRSFLKTTKIKLLLTIHTCLLKIVKAKNYKLREIKADIDFTTVKDNNKTALYEVLQDNTLFPENCTMKDIDNDVSVKLIEHINEFLYKIQNLNSGFGKKVAPENYTSNWDLDNFTKLKVWVPNENHTLRRIFNSRAARIDWYSFMASVHVGGEFVCAGSIIKKYFVITAASCLFDLLNPISGKDRDVYVRVGSQFTSYGGVAVAVIEIFLHPSFDPNTLQHNLAILRMDDMIRIAKKMKKITKIAYSKENVTFMGSIFMLGWGAKNGLNEDYKYQKLSYAYIDAYDFGKCEEVYSSLYVTDNNFCAGLKNRGSGACAKDLGDPAIVDGMLVGVVSYGPPLCGTPDAPTVFTKISYYAEWIESVVQRIMVYKQALRSPEPVTPAFSLKSNIDGIFQHTRPILDYPEEMTILREILEDLAKTNGSLIDEVIDESFKKEILNSLQLTTKTHIFHHPLINKTIVPVHGVHIPVEHAEEYHPVSLTTSSLFSYPWQKESIQIPVDIREYDELMAEYEYFKTTPVTTTTVPRLTKRPISSTPEWRFTDIAVFDRKGDQNYEDSQSSSSSDESNKGLSIEMTTAKIFDEALASASRERSEDVEKNKDTHLLFYIDSRLPDDENESSKTKRVKKAKKKRNKKKSEYRDDLYTKVPVDSYDYDYRFDIDIEK